VGLVHDSPQPQATTLGQQQHLTPPHGRLRGCHVSRKSDILQDINSESGPPWESAGPLDIQSGPPSLVQDPHVYGPDPWNGIRTPPRMGSGPPTVGSQGSRTEHTRALIRAQVGVRCRHVSGPIRIHSCSPLRRRPDAATWHTTRGISQQAEPSMMPLGYTRLRIHYGKGMRLSIPLIGDMLTPRYMGRAVTHHYSRVTESYYLSMLHGLRSS
jgi:hypothetical protein